MKFSNILAVVATIFPLLATAAEDETFIPTEQKPYLFKIQYTVADKQESINDLVELTNGETFTLQYTFFNGEDEDVSVIGVGGSFNHPTTGFLTNNITTASLGPVVIPSGQFANFTQHVGVDVVPGSYLVVPAIYAVYNNSMILLGSRSQLVNVEDAKISFFNPQLIFLELVLIGTIGGIVYFAYQAFGKQYFRSNQPIKVATVKRAVPADQTTSSAATKSSGYDESWLPKQHLKSTKKAKRT